MLLNLQQFAAATSFPHLSISEMLLPSFNWPQHDCFAFAEAEGNIRTLEQPVTRIGTVAEGEGVRPEEPRACKNMQKEGWVTHTQLRIQTRPELRLRPCFSARKVLPLGLSTQIQSGKRNEAIYIYDKIRNKYTHTYIATVI